ncbi:DUF3971 domain-containing protein [Reyranella sp.]|uniref:YhdP family protein n=1 Tax=Reyranella sp. TaxID=1929291 RepID=UPI002717E1D9|nr:DUF3971 domain-containing protein [Reyranella sp.]MDO8976150.1 DUF3971 domain-containing protein [Reyranella sp.]
MVKRTYRVVLRIAVGLVLATTALVVVAALRLMSGPVDLDFMKPRIARLIDAPGNDIHPDFDRIFFEWSGISRPIKLAFTGLRFTNGQNQVIATAPEAALTFEPRSVVQGMLLPTSIAIIRPVIEADVAREGGAFQRIFTSPKGGAQGEAISILVDQLLAEPNYKSLIGQLDSVVVERADVTIRDLKTGLSWNAPEASAELRRDAAGVSITANARFAGHGDPVDLSLSGVYTRDRSRISLEAKVSGFKPWIFADLSSDLAILRGVDLALSGRLQIEGTGKGEVKTVAVEINGANGSVTLPGILPVAHQVRSMDARFSIDNVAHTSKIERVDFDFGAARVVVTGAGHRISETRHFAGRAEIRRIPVDKLADYWPLEFAEGGRRWAITNVTAGTIDVAAEFAASAPVDHIADIKMERMAAFLDYGGLTVRYMPHMPEMQDVSGKARYENGNLHFDIARGGAVNLKVTDGTIDLTGLDKPAPQMAAIRLPITGSAQDIMRFLARPRLGLPKETLYDHRRLGGQVAVGVSLSFPLIDALTVAEIDVAADAHLTAFSLKDVLGDVDLTDATARVKYGNSELSVVGQGKLDGSVVDVTWREMFAAKAPFRRRYDVKGTVPAGLVEKAGFPSIEPYVVGPIGTTLHYQVATNGTGEVGGRFDMKAAKLDVIPLAWSKEAGTEALATMTLKLAAGGKITTADFDGRGGGLQAKGQVRFGGDSSVQQISLQQVKIGQTDIAVDWRRNPGGVDIAIKGQALELQRVHDMLRNRNQVAAREPKGAASVSRTSTKAQIQLQNVIVKRGSLGYLNGRLELVGDRVASADLTMGGGKGTTLRVTPAAQGRTLFFYVADFGQLLTEAGWIDGLVGGHLHIEGKFNDTWADPPLEGTLKMGPFRLQRMTPRRDIGTLNSAIDGLNSAGNALQQFDSLSANLTKAGDVIQIRNGRTSGQSIGLTTQGVIDLGKDTVRLNGIVVPAFALNNLLSNVPLLGPLLTGGKDGGMFAVSYQLHGPFDDLKADVNMMSAMAPGALRDVFSSPSTTGREAPGQPIGSPEMQRAP